MPLHDLLYVAGIIFFCYFYTAIIFNPDDVAENMRKYGGFIPGIRPGKRTAEYIDTILARLTLVGAVYLALVAILPQFLITGTNVTQIPFIGEQLVRGAAALRHRGHERAVLLRRHVDPDHRRRVDGHRAAGRVAAHHAALRRLHEEDAHPRQAGAVGGGAQRPGALNVVMLGAPGRRQGHAGRTARPQHGLPKISTGDILREAVQAGTELGCIAKATMEAGNLVGDDVMIGIVQERLEREDARAGFVLDGFPRTVVQAAALDR
jgi:hypothetical protein